MKTPAAPRPASRSQTDVVVQEVKQMILGGALVPGRKLPIEADLAATLGVSRSSLREGVRALAAMGILETRQGDGTYVTSLDPSILLAPMGFLVDLQQDGQIGHISAVRRVLEMEAASRAALCATDQQLELAAAAVSSVAEVSENPTSNEDHQRILDADIAFHRVIAEASKNPALAALIEALSSRTVQTRLWRSISEQGATAHTQRQHVAILSAVTDRDPDRARLMMGVHLTEVEQFAAAHPGSASADLGSIEAV
ncbi:FadR/GntR family transcriptional regulator [Agreia bicolorata]|uniref:HTH gntR-type domain-containing protein n=1 Tax=Agreia bicolorata TaxID=110935 RepID=A0ABR5CFR5_9MICO|nr:FadR/GntR family transcriptional regulator [Agreia bicolorata]KJC64435.1 hypothetical protein TZ00_08415 [Agreia bicolorata]